MVDERDAYRVLQVDSEAHETVIRAAYRALAALYHPDRDPSSLANRRMAELNDAYNKVRTRDRREAYDRLRSLARAESGGGASGSARPAGGTATSSGGSTHAGERHGARRDQVKAGPDTIDFGRYAGWSIKQLARHDPDYLRWLSRHSSGIRFRRPIEEALAAVAATTPPAREQPENRKRGRR